MDAQDSLPGLSSGKWEQWTAFYRREKVVLGVPKAPKYIGTRLVTEFDHFVFRKMNVPGKHSMGLVARCLSNSCDVKGDWSEARGFLTEGFLEPLAGAGLSENDFVTFRLLVLYHFRRHVERSHHLSKYVRVNGKEIEPAAATGTKTAWHKLVPTFRPNKHSVMRKAFQATKHTTCRFWENLFVQKLQAVLKRYTIECPMELADLVLGKEVSFLYRGHEVSREAVIYQLLNAHINWYSALHNSVVATSRTLSNEAGPPDGHGYNTFCTNCYRIFTVRTKDRKDNPKHLDMVYCTDTHSLVSSCCGALIGSHSLVGSQGGILEFTINKKTFCVNKQGRVVQA